MNNDESSEEDEIIFSFVGNAYKVFVKMSSWELKKFETTKGSAA